MVCFPLPWFFTPPEGRVTQKCSGTENCQTRLLQNQVTRKHQNPNTEHRKHILTRSSHRACYCDVALEDDSTIARALPSEHPPFDFPKIGGCQPRTIPRNDLLHQVVFWGGWCANCRNLRKRQIRTTPSFALTMLIVDFVGVVRGFRSPTKTIRWTSFHARDPCAQGLSPIFIECTPRGLCNRTLLRRVLRRFSNSKCFLEGFLEGACKGFW